LKAASVYARMGWRVIPLHDVVTGRCSCGEDHLKKDGTSNGSEGKHPRLSGWVRNASNDADTVAEWLEEFPTANIGVATGAASGFFVLDVDPEHGGDETLAALVAEHGELPATVRAQTGSGGTHYLFKLPGFTVTNKAGRFASGLLKGLDIRGDGGQIVVAPSKSLKGSYSWVVPPWAGQISDAPTWLIDELRPTRNAMPDAPGEESRGYFPPASEEVLDAARQVLEQHGPAIDGSGGGLHTVHAAAILTHDFALTDDEAWPLFVEWNETCLPPWDLEGEDSLRVMLGRGRKYGKLEYGCRRSMDALQASKKVLADWNGKEETMVTMLKDVRNLVRVCGDVAIAAIIARDTQDRTGLNIRDLGLPKPMPKRADPKPGDVAMTVEISKTADQVMNYLAPHVFARNGVLCEVVRTNRTFIRDLGVSRIRDLMSQRVNFTRDDEKGTKRIAAPEDVARIIKERPHTGIRVLEAVTTAPVFLADGSILQDRGYNAAARVFLEPSVTVFIADQPTQEDAVKSVAIFEDLLGDFRFLSKADFSSWLAALLSPLVKAATANAPAPLVCISASSPGAGKSLLADVIARIVTGDPAEVRPYNPRDDGEWSKRLTAFVKAAAPITVFDNVNGEIGDDGLNRLITSSVWSDRILGASDAPPLPIVTTWLANGNNIAPAEDMVRRVLMCRIEVDSERPQERADFKRPLLLEYALEQRPALLAAALTILRAYHCAGRPTMNLPAWGSFGMWSSLVRNAIVWAGAPDPFLTQQRAFKDMNEPENDTHDFWLSVVADSDGKASSIVAAANARGAVELLGLRDPLTTRRLRNFLTKFIDKPRQGRRIRRNGPTYTVEVIPSSSPSP
jgi:hypothetical protein